MAYDHGKLFDKSFQAVAKKPCISARDLSLIRHREAQYQWYRSRTYGKIV